MTSCLPSGEKIEEVSLDTERSPASVETSSPTPPLPKEEWIGAWRVGDISDLMFDLIILPNHTALTTWTEGENGIRGEFGKWTLQGESIILHYDSGWKDILRATKEGTYEKWGYAPGQPIVEGQHNNQTSIEKIQGPMAPFLGIWQGTDTQGKPLFYLVIESDGSAQKSNNEEASGNWVVIENIARIVWTDNTYNELALTKNQSGLLRIWRENSPRQSPPAATLPVSLIQKGKE